MQQEKREMPKQQDIGSSYKDFFWTDVVHIIYQPDPTHVIQNWYHPIVILVKKISLGAHGQNVGVL